MKILTEIQSIAVSAPDTLAVSSGGTNLDSLTYAKFVAQISALEKLFSAHAHDNEFVFVIANRSNFLASAIVAALAAGTPIAVIDHRLGPHRIGQILKQGKQVFGLVDGLGERTLSKISADQTKHVGFIKLEDIEKGEADKTPQPLNVADISPSNTAVILFTSGSTGEPKGVEISRGDLQSRLNTEVDWFQLTEQDQILGVLPLSFDVGLTQMLGTFSAGAHHILLNSWLPKDIIARINQIQPAGMAMSPVVWKNLLNAPNQDEWWRAANKLRYLTLSGGTLGSADLKKMASHLIDCGLVKTYGQTEMFRIASLRLKEHPDKIESVGRAYPEVQLEIRDESGKLCAPGEVGEIVAGGNGLMRGYLGAEPDPKQEFDTQSIRTGDFGFIDVDGFLHIKGRKDHMVKILDQRVYPDDVADSIREITGLSEVVVIDVLIDDQAALIAFVICNAQKGETDKQIGSFFKLLRGQLASHLIPRDIIALDSMPHTASGKIDRVALKEQFYPGHQNT